MRCRVVVVVVVGLASGCVAERVPLKPLPALVAPGAPVAALDAYGMRMPVESLVWDVQWDGITIARAELVVTAGHARSRFATTGLAATIASIRHELVTDLDPENAHALAFRELLDDDGARTEVASGLARVHVGERVVAVPGGGHAHTLHSALGVLRMWAVPNAPAGFLYVVHAGKLFRLDVASPTSVDLQNARTIRIDAHVRDPDAPISIAMWLSADERRTPLRVEITRGDAKLVAELVTDG